MVCYTIAPCNLLGAQHPSTPCRIDVHGISLHAGPVVTAATSQVFPTSSANVWFSYISSLRREFLALGTASQTVLYGWRGVFAPVQGVPANGVTGFTAFSPAAGEDILVVANGGSPGSREIDSYVYRITAEETLTMVCQYSKGFCDLNTLPTCMHRSILCLQLELLMWCHSGLPPLYSGMWWWPMVWMILATPMSTQQCTVGMGLLYS